MSKFTPQELCDQITKELDSVERSLINDQHEAAHACALHLAHLANLLAQRTAPTHVPFADVLKKQLGRLPRILERQAS